MKYLNYIYSRLTGQQATTDGGNENDFELGVNVDDDSDEKSRSRSHKVRIMSQNFQVKSDLNLSIHQLAEVGNTETIRIKLKDGESVNKLDGDQLAALHYAVRYHHDDTVELLLKNNADVNIRGQDDRTPLHYAARSRIYTRQEIEQTDTDKTKMDSMIYKLKYQQANVNAQDKYGQTPLHFAAMTGNISAANDLVNCGAQVQIEDTHRTTPLIVAATYGHLEMVKLFLSIPGVDFRHADASKQTALHRAAKGGYLTVVQLLLNKARGNKDFKNFLDGKDRKHKTPLYHAANNGHTQVVSLLLKEGANVNVENINLATPLHAAAGVGNVSIINLFLKHNVKLNFGDIWQKTPLMYAVAGNHTEAIKLLLSRKANIDKRDINQSTPLLIAAQNGHCSAMQILLKAQANPKAVDKLDRSATYHCAEQGKTQALQELFKSKLYPPEQIDEVDCYGFPPLHVAVMKGHLDTMLMLLKRGATAGKKNEEQDTALHIAAKKGYVSMVQELLPLSCTMLNAENEDLDTPLHLACKWGKEEVVRELLQAGADVKATNFSSSTPLHLAAFKGHVGCCQMLLEAHAPTDLFNKENKTPLILAVLEGHVGVTRLLLDHGASLEGASKSHMNVLELATNAGKGDIALTIIQSQVWEKGMKRISNDEKGYRVTPFRRMIEKLPKVAEVVLNRCITTTESLNDLLPPDQTINFEYLDDTYQNSITGISCFDDDGHLASNATRYHRDARKVKQNHPLMLMIKYKLPNLLSHPVCVTLIKHKWTTYGRIVYFGNFALYLLYLLALTIYVIACKDLHWIDANLTDKVVEYRHAEDCNEIDWDDWQVFLLLKVCKWVVGAIAGLELIKEITQAYSARCSYLGVENLVEWICYVCAVSFLINFHNCPIKEDWQWQLGATSIFLSWINLLLFIRVFPFFGIYVIMFTEVLKSFCSFFLLFFFFVIAFALSFYTVLNDNHGFRTPQISLLRTSVMMIGEINFEGVFNNHDDPLQYPEVTYILLIAFLIFMSILIMNLLVGLAVDDIKAVQEQAMLQKLAMQTKLVLEIEMGIPEFMKRKHILGKLKIVRNGNLGVLRKLLRKLGHHQGREVSEVEELKREVIQLKESVSRLVDLTSSMSELFELKSRMRGERHGQGVSPPGGQDRTLGRPEQNRQNSGPSSNLSETGLLQDGIDF